MEMIKVDELIIPYTDCIRVQDLVASFKPGAELFVVSGCHVSPETEPSDGDVCCLIKRCDNNAIQTQKIRYSVYIIDNGASAAGTGSGLIPPGCNRGSSSGKPVIAHIAWK